MEREGALGLDRGDVDQSPTTLSFEVRKRGHRSVDLAHEVDVYDARELLRSRLLEGGEEAHCGEVHPGVQPPELLYSAVGHSLYLIELRSIGGDGDRFAALSPDLLYEGVEPLLAAGRDHHPCTTLGEPESRLPSYAAGGAHQRHNLLFYWLESHHHYSFFEFRLSYELAARTRSEKVSLRVPDAELRELSRVRSVGIHQWHAPQRRNLAQVATNRSGHSTWGR